MMIVEWAQAGDPVEPTDELPCRDSEMALG
jgi:hypothetical protein